MIKKGINRSEKEICLMILRARTDLCVHVGVKQRDGWASAWWSRGQVVVVRGGRVWLVVVEAVCCFSCRYCWRALSSWFCLFSALQIRWENTT